MKIIAYKEAKNKGLLHYFTCKPCKHGHIAKRLTSNGNCLECIRIKSRRDYHQDIESSRLYNRIYYLNNIDNKREQGRANYHRHKEGYCAKARDYNRIHRENANRNRRIARQLNPWPNRLQCRKRKAMRKSALGFFTYSDIMQLLFDQNCLCVNCQTFIRDSYTIDHIIPLSRGGTNWPHNIQLLCHSCNSSKNDKTWEEFIEWQFDVGLLTFGEYSDKVQLQQWG